LNRNVLTFNICSCDLDNTALWKKTQVIRKICKMDLNSHLKNYKESTPLYTSTPTFPKSPCNEQACTPKFCLLSHWPQDKRRSLRGELLGGNNILETAAYPAAWPALKKFKNALFSLTRVCRQHRSGLPQHTHSHPFSLRQTDTYQQLAHLHNKTALLADKAELVTTEMCFQSSIISCFDLADGAAADSFLSIVT